MNKLEYREQLMTSAWKVKSAAILERDNRTCQKCGATGVKLNVHHKYYLENHAAWEYDDDALITLCSKCHVGIHDKEVNFVKFYAERIFEITDITGFELAVLLAMVQFMGYDNVVDFAQRKKLIVTSGLGVKMQSLNNIISRLNKTDLICRIGHGCYMVNPRYFSRGEWSDIKKIVYPPIATLNQKHKHNSTKEIPLQNE